MREGIAYKRRLWGSKQINFRVKPKLLADLERLAEQDGVDRSEIVRRACAEFVERREGLQTR